MVIGSINFILKQHQFMLKKKTNVDVKHSESRSSAPFLQLTFVLYATSLETVTLRLSSKRILCKNKLTGRKKRKKGREMKKDGETSTPYPK